MIDSRLGTTVILILVAGMLVACQSLEENENATGIRIMTIVLIVGGLATIIHVAETRAKNRAKKEAAAEAERLQQRFQQLQSEETGRLKAIRELVHSGNLEKAEVELEQLSIRLRELEYPGNRKSVAEVFYKLILNSLRGYPRWAPLALTFGRLSYGIGRENDTPSVYDEAAITNDIGVYR